jgi:hypothetical protein
LADTNPVEAGDVVVDEAAGGGFVVVVLVRSEVVVGAGCLVDDGEEELDEPQALMTAASITNPAASAKNPEERPDLRPIRRLTLTKNEVTREVDIT